MQVKSLTGPEVLVINQIRNSEWEVSKILIESDMWSADHYETEVKCTMTQLSQLIESCGDTIFKVSFRKKIDQK